MKELYGHIWELYCSGTAPVDIAETLKVPLDWVLSALQMENV
jgi:hypothetical protein